LQSTQVVTLTITASNPVSLSLLDSTSLSSCSAGTLRTTKFSALDKYNNKVENILPGLVALKLTPDLQTNQQVTVASNQISLQLTCNLMGTMQLSAAFPIYSGASLVTPSITVTRGPISPSKSLATLVNSTSSTYQSTVSAGSTLRWQFTI